MEVKTREQVMKEAAASVARPKMAHGAWDGDELFRPFIAQSQARDFVKQVGGGLEYAGIAWVLDAKYTAGMRAVRAKG